LDGVHQTSRFLDGRIDLFDRCSIRPPDCGLATTGSGKLRVYSLLLYWVLIGRSS
jgi:hypothetical protein